MDFTPILKTLAPAAGGAAVPILAMIMWAAPRDDFDLHRLDFEAYQAAEAAKDNRQLILDTVERASALEPGEYKQSLCRTLEQAIAELCAVASEDALCKDRAILRRRAGCQPD